MLRTTALLLRHPRGDDLEAIVAHGTLAGRAVGGRFPIEDRLMADRIRKLLGDSVVSAIEKLMGLVLTAIAVEMILAGLKRYFVGGL